jgi:hypothetical protein
MYIYRERGIHSAEVNMEHPPVLLTDLPDEMLMAIFKRLSNAAVLYSLLDVNVRLDRIARDPVFSSCITLMQHPLSGLNCPLTGSVLDRFCLHILPQIQHNVTWLNVEATSMECILASNYPNLRGLGLFSITNEMLLRLFTGKRTGLDRFTQTSRT